ncbi:MAG: cysteine hydrolase family protein [Acidobacteria bacterium]|nr:cysteine hydrolase family protein [Acidobacteriota bacterium]
MPLLKWILLAAAATTAVTIPIRSRVESVRGSNAYQEVVRNEQIDPARTAIILCDMWDKHWCRGATARVGVLTEKVNPVLRAARAKGVLIIHAPSETMNFYKDAPQRRAILAIAPASPPLAKEIPSLKLPIDDSGGGCDTEGDKFYKAWTRQHPAIEIGPNDLISDKGEEVYSALKLRGIQHLLVAGVHTNMCILNRSFAIKQMTKWGVRCILLRDLTDAMYDPKDAPYVSHDKGTALVIEHIEEHWAPTMLSKDLLAGLR